MVPKWSLEAPPRPWGKFLNFLKLSQNDPKAILKWFQNDPKTIPKWSQSYPKTIPNWFQNNPKTIHKSVGGEVRSKFSRSRQMQGFQGLWPIWRDLSYPCKLDTSKFQPEIFQMRQVLTNSLPKPHQKREVNFDPKMIPKRSLLKLTLS